MNNTQKQTKKGSKIGGVALIIAALIAAPFLGYAAFEYHAALKAPEQAALNNAVYSDKEIGEMVARREAALAAEEAKALEKQDIKMVAVGDITFSTAYAKDLGDPNARLSEVRDIISSADLSFGNLETPIAAGGTRWPNKTFHFLAPPTAAPALFDAGFNILSVANNHTLDFGRDAFSETLQHLNAAGIAAIGGGENLEEAQRARIIEMNGQKIAFLAQSQILPAEFAATAERNGSFFSGNVDKMAELVAEVKPEVDYVIVSMHWGQEAHYDANGRQVNFAHQLVDAGADVILGHHPHRIQGVEFYKDSLIAYSLSNFVFSVQKRESAESFIFNFTLGEDGIKDVYAQPVYIRSNNPVPVDPTSADGKNITKLLTDTATKLGTQAQTDGEFIRFSPRQ